MTITAKIIFHNSTSRALGRALHLAERFKSFKRGDGDAPNQLIADAEELRLRWREFEAIWEVVRNWRGSSLWLDECEALPQQIRERTRVLECSEQHRLAVVPDAHCNPRGHACGWGCRYHVAISSTLPQSAYEDRVGSRWYHFGSFAGEGIWQIDKPALKTALAREATAQHLHLCAVYDPTAINKRVDDLPDQIDVTKDQGWEVLHEDRAEGGSIVKTAVRIAPLHRARAVGLDIGVHLGTSSPAPKEPTGPKPERNIPEVKFEDIGGIDDILQTVREVIELPLKHPELFERLGISPHRGVLLYGPPGCGKTLMAKAIAHEVQAHFILVAGPEILSKWHGESEKNLRTRFEEARDLQPSIIFFDEIDAIASRRSVADENRLSDRIVNQLLALMDGVRSYGRVCVLASTNRPDLIDEAILRPGRFDYKIEVMKPTLPGCERILDVCLRQMPVHPAFDRQAFARRLLGLSGADIAFIAREAAYNCMRRTIDIAGVITGGATLDDKAPLLIGSQDFAAALDARQRGRSGKASE